ncbi:MAG: hypothetical protein JXA99_09400 [Candidatus Lokiarchaeota archaeon]|nr:hypothetical protein [Candidatus Lokiarchaeota archaeon]
MMEFIINKYLKLRLEDQKTFIYVNNMKVLQCKYLLLNNFIDNIENNPYTIKKISIDEQAENLDNSLEREDLYSIDISPETEFWAHSSNLQAWYENNYNSNVLHSNLAFPLLRRLSRAGDIKAKKVFKDEIINRFRNGNLNVMTFLIKEGYLDELDIEVSDLLYQELDFETYKILKNKLKESNKNKERFIF